MATKSKSKKRPPLSADQQLAALMREIDWLRDARSDDAVSEEEWHRKGKMVMMKGSRLPRTHTAAFQEYYLSMQHLEAAEQLEASLGDSDEITVIDSDDLLEDASTDDAAPSRETAGAV